MFYFLLTHIIPFFLTCFLFFILSHHHHGYITRGVGELHGTVWSGLVFSVLSCHFERVESKKKKHWSPISYPLTRLSRHTIHIFSISTVRRQRHVNGTLRRIARNEPPPQKPILSAVVTPHAQGNPHTPKAQHNTSGEVRLRHVPSLPPSTAQPSPVPLSTLPYNTPFVALSRQSSIPTDNPFYCSKSSFPPPHFYHRANLSVYPPSDTP